jgi:hypothetical protein
VRLNTCNEKLHQGLQIVAAESRIGWSNLFLV